MSGICLTKAGLTGLLQAAGLFISEELPCLSLAALSFFPFLYSTAALLVQEQALRESTGLLQSTFLTAVASSSVSPGSYPRTWHLWSHAQPPPGLENILAASMRTLSLLL